MRNQEHEEGGSRNSVIPKAPSPMRLQQNFDGNATLAPIISGSPNPRWVVCPSRVDQHFAREWPWNRRDHPAQNMTHLSPADVRVRDLAHRSWP